MSDFLNTTLRNISWFKGVDERGELDMKPPFQRNPVWVNRQKSYLMDTILNKYPIPEIYMQEIVKEDGKTRYIVVDGQQRIRSVLEFLNGDFNLDVKESPEFEGAYFNDLSAEQKKAFFAYSFVVRILPDISEPEIRSIFQRLNRNVVSLNKQELRQATYSGPFLSLMNSISDKDVFRKINIFTPNDVRRMLDVEYLSEIAIATLNGLQNKKDKLDTYYQLYEDYFDEGDELKETFDEVTLELVKILPNINDTRWCKKTDFYSLFIVFANHREDLPLAKDSRADVGRLLTDFSNDMARFVKVNKEDGEGHFTPLIEEYGKGIRATSDLSSRRYRNNALEKLLENIW